MGMPTLDELADYLNRLTPREREVLLEKVRHRDFLERLEALSRRYRHRLAREGRLADTPEDVLAALRDQREDLVRRDHPE